MQSMNISLPDPLKKFVDGQIARNRSLPLRCCRDDRDGGKRQTLASGGDDGGEVLPGRSGATATGFDKAGEQSKGAGALFRARAVTDVARNHPVP